MKEINGKNKMGFDVDTETYEKKQNSLASADRISWIVVVIVCGYLAYTLAREAMQVWELWILVGAFVLIALGGVNEIIRK